MGEKFQRDTFMDLTFLSKKKTKWKIHTEEARGLVEVEKKIVCDCQKILWAATIHKKLASERERVNNMFEFTIYIRTKSV